MHRDILKEEYRRWPWFYNRTKLLDEMSFSYHECDHDLPPKTPEEKESFDYFFINEARLTARGFKSVSINCCSPMERSVIRHWAEQRGKRVYIQQPTPCTEIWPIIGESTSDSWGLTMEPLLLDEFKALAAAISERPSLVVFEGCEKLPNGVRPLMRNKNVLIQPGRYGIAISFEIISTEAYAKLLELVAQHSKREEAPAERWSSCTSTNSTFYVTTYASVA